MVSVVVVPMMGNILAARLLRLALLQLSLKGAQLSEHVSGRRLCGVGRALSGLVLNGLLECIDIN